MREGGSEREQRESRERERERESLSGGTSQPPSPVESQRHSNCLTSKEAKLASRRPQFETLCLPKDSKRGEKRDIQEGGEGQRKGDPRI